MRTESTSMNRDFFMLRAGRRVHLRAATNLADAVYRIQHEIVTIPEYQFTGTRLEFADWYTSCHEFTLDG